MAKRSKQFEFVGEGFKKPGDSFGGSQLKGNPKTKRPLDSKMPIHLTLRAAQSGMRSMKPFAHINQTLERVARKYGVRVYAFANVGNHLHVCLKLSHISRWAPFIRELTGQIAEIMRKHLKVEKKFWLYRPHTRIVRGWKKAYRRVMGYIQLNNLEAEGLANRHEMRALKEMREIFADVS